jgi:Cof subfamily protein (haloacid dehalogenase superfamily)
MTSPEVGALIALDVDGTLITRDHRVLPDVRGAVQNFRARGVAVALVSARSLGGMRIILDQLGAVDHIISFGGALVLSRLDDQFIPAAHIAETRIAPGDFKAACQAGFQRGLALAAYGTRQTYVERTEQLLLREFSITQEPYQVSSFETLPELPHKLLAIAAPGQHQELSDLAAQLDARLSVARSHATYLEIGPKGVSKGSALSRLVSSLGLDISNVAAIGDSENDESMLRVVGHPIAMGNAIESVKNIAAFVTKTNDEGGVAHAIQHLSERRWKLPSHPTAFSSTGQ